MPLATGQALIYNSTTSKWTNQKPTVTDCGDVVLTSVTNGDVLKYSGGNWINGTIPTAGVSTDTTTTTLNLSSYSTATFIHYTASSITVSNGPSTVNGTVLGGVTVQFETDGDFFNQRLYAGGSIYYRSGNISNINSAIWKPLYTTTVSNVTNYTVIDALSTPPSSPADGDTYYILTSPTGAWSSFTVASLAVYNATSSTWTNIALTNGVVIVLSIPDNLSSLSTGYYYAGQNCIYNTLFTPVVTSVYLSPTTVTLPATVDYSNIVFKKIVPLKT